jgi:hypothetical protein
VSVKVIAIDNQANGVFSSGLIVENKPIGFPQDKGIQQPISNLFYWANAWSEKGGLIGEHPHKMFEIMSFILKGEIQHYDSKFDRWITLKEGDAQIIRSGSGISHAERMLPNSRMFQIWFDPNIKKSVLKEASYNDYKSTDMNFIDNQGVHYKNYVGNGGPIEMDSEGISIREVTYESGNHSVQLSENNIHTMYLLNGDVCIPEKDLAIHDFLIVQDQEKLELSIESEATFFEIIAPKQLSYKTYKEVLK